MLVLNELSNRVQPDVFGRFREPERESNYWKSGKVDRLYVMRLRATDVTQYSAAALRRDMSGCGNVDEIASPGGAVDRITVTNSQRTDKSH